MCTKPALANVFLASYTRTPTKHVSLVVLASSLVSNVGLNSQPDNGQVFNGVVVWLDSPNNTETLAIMNVLTKLV